MSGLLLPGTEVEARGLRWEVADAQSLGPQTVYRLRGLAGIVSREEIDLLYPFEPIEPVVHDLRPDRAAPLRNWLVYHQAFLLEQALGPDALLATQPGRLRLEPYQLVPVLRAIRMSRPRLLLADGVGLGKTIQAGLVLTELMARRLAHRILIVSPAGPLLEQWRLEMIQRFGLRLDVIDRARLEEIRRATEVGANPFDHVPLGLASIDFLKQERILDLLERASYDAVVVDEAHHCTDLGQAGEREDSLRRRLAETLARRCDTLLLLTATPHDGHDRSFASLCELLDPSLVDGRGELRGDRYRTHVVRRLKRHITDPATGQPRFRERNVRPQPVTASPERHARFMALQRALLDLVAPELRRAFRTRRYSDVLAFLALLKRSVSSVEACRSTLGVVAERLQQVLREDVEDQETRRQRLRTLRDYHRTIERFGAGAAEEERQRQLLESEDLARQLAALERETRREARTLTRTTTVVGALDELVAMAGEAIDEDPKLEQLVAEVQGIRRAEPATNVLVYTEYVDSQRAAARALMRAGVGEVLTLSGEDDDATRGKITSRFCTSDGIVLVSTDTTAEGLNLQARCHHLIHLELPFNPNRLEQRNGRIDRYGQTHDPLVCYLFLRGTFEERILLRLIAKYERQRARLTFVPNTLGVTASEEAPQARLLRGLLEEDTRLFRDFEQMAVRCCYSFENRRKLFEIDSRFKFALVVASRQGPTSEFACAFYLHDDEWLFSEGRRDQLVYTLDFVRRTGGEYLSLLELRTAKDFEVARVCFSNGEPFGDVCGRLGIRLGRELNMTDDAWRFTPTAEVLPGGEDPRDPEVARRLLDLGYLVLHEGKTFRQYDDHWGDRPRYVVARDRLADRELVLRRALFFRLGYRDIAGPGDQNVSIFNLHPPGITTGHTAPLEHRPYERPNSAALLLLAVLNTLSFDWLLQLRVRSHLNQFMLLSTPLPKGIGNVPAKNYFAHGALRLTCNHAGYAPLWREQMGDAWRESTSPGTWPVLASEDERWAARTTIDAIVADAYGLSREQYANVLSTFRHSSYPKAPELCLQRFDELKAIGLEAFTRKRDPYWDIPLNESPPQPVIELPIPSGESLREPQGDLYPTDQEGVPLRRVAETAPGYVRARGGRAGQGNSRGAGRARRR